MSDALVTWGPSGPQPISPLSFFDVRHYLAELILRNHGQLIIPDQYQWSRVSVADNEALISLLPIDPTQGIQPLTLRIRYLDLVELLEPLLVERVFDFAGEITPARIIASINQVAGVALLRADQFQFSELAGIVGTTAVTMTPTAGNLLGVGSLRVNVRQVNTDVDVELGYETEPFTQMVEAVVEMCLEGSNEPLEITDQQGSRQVYSDGSYLDSVDEDTIEFRAGMLRNYWARIRLPGRKFSAEINGANVNVVLELDSLTDGQVTLHLDSVQPLLTLGTVAGIGTVTGVYVNDYVGLNFNALSTDPNGVASHYQQRCRVRLRLIKEQ